jgi:hypothetical protein
VYINDSTVVSYKKCLLYKTAFNIGWIEKDVYVYTALIFRTRRSHHSVFFLNGSTASKSALKISPQIFLLKMLWRWQNLNSSDTYYNYYQILTIFLTVCYNEVILYVITEDSMAVIIWLVISCALVGGYQYFREAWSLGSKWEWWQCSLITQAGCMKSGHSDPWKGEETEASLSQRKQWTEPLLVSLPPV